MGKSRPKKKSAPESRWRSLLKKPWLFAGAAFGLDLAMLVAGMALSAVKLPVEYTVTDGSVERTQPLAFFGIVAAVVLGVVCVLTGLIIAGAFLKKRRGVQILGAAGLLAVSLAMLGSSAFMALGSPVKSRDSVSYSDEELSLIVEETLPYFGSPGASFFLTGKDGGKAVLLVSTELNEYALSEDRYSISWVDESTIMISFEDGINYRQLKVPIDRSELDS